MEPAPTHGKISWLDISQVHVVPRHLGCHSFGQSFSLCSTYSSRSLLWDGNLPVWPQKITHMVLNTPAVASSWTKGDGHTTWISRNLDCRKNGLEKFFSFFLLIFPLYFHWNLRKEKCFFLSSSTQCDTANLKNFHLGLGSLAPLLVVSKSKDIKIPIHVQDKRKFSFQLLPWGWAAENRETEVSSCDFCWDGLLNSFVSWPWSSKEGARKYPAVLLLCWWCFGL